MAAHNEITAGWSINGVSGSVSWSVGERLISLTLSSAFPLVLLSLFFPNRWLLVKRQTTGIYFLDGL